MTPPTDTQTPYYRLDPDTVIRAIESTGLLCDGRLLALNSYENRVYQVGIEDALPLVAKFYRPGRWTDDAILEEHAFSAEIADAEVPLVPPMAVGGATLHHHEGFRFALFERRGGHAPELDQKDTRLWLGRFLGRLHAVGAVRGFRHRPALTPQRFGHESIATILGGDWLPGHLAQAFESLAADLMTSVEAAWQRAGDLETIRLHGDCHPGNILWRDGPFFVDMDDCQSGPAVQDLWMLLSGERDEMSAQFKDILDGYREFHHFPLSQLGLIEALRTLRMLHHAAWLARRWEDPAFPIAFPWFGEPRYWEDLVLGLREQLGAMQEPALELPYF
ncbi:MAG: serine/threonine protein kinase [Xanthomonadales bacterium]|nr:serine/threonine protein kinase [Xanthomonadales bacterium]